MSEEDEKIIAGMEQALSDTKEASDLKFALVVALAEGGYITFMRSATRAEPAHLRQVAGLLLGYANKLAGLAERIEDLVTVTDSGEPPS